LKEYQKETLLTVEEFVLPAQSLLIGHLAYPKMVAAGLGGCEDVLVLALPVRIIKTRLIAKINLVAFGIRQPEEEISF